CPTNRKYELPTKRRKSCRYNQKDYERNYGAKQNTNYSTDKCKYHRLCKKLIENVFRSCSNSFSQTDFTRSFCHRHKHNVHNTNTSHKKRDGRNSSQEISKCCGNDPKRCKKFGLIYDL